MMSIAETIEFVSVYSGCTKAQSRAVIDALEILVAASVSTDREVSLPFGKFDSYMSTPTTGRNPSTGEAIDIPAKRRLKFRFYDSFEELVQNPVIPPPPPPPIEKSIPLPPDNDERGRTFTRTERSRSEAAKPPAKAPPKPAKAPKSPTKPPKPVETRHGSTTLTNRATSKQYLVPRPVKSKSAPPISLKGIEIKSRAKSGSRPMTESDLVNLKPTTPILFKGNWTTANRMRRFKHLF